MARTDWSQVIFDKQLATAKSAHKKQFITERMDEAYKRSEKLRREGGDVY